MNIKQLTTCLLLSAILTLAGVTGVHAQTVMYTPVEAQTFTNLGSAIDPLTFKSFNTSLGTLVSVEVVLENVTLSGTATALNDSGSNPPEVGGPEDLKVFLTGTIDVIDASDSNLDVNLDTDSPSYSSVPTNPNGVPINGTFSHNYSPAVAGSPSGASQTLTGTFPSTPELDAYKGNGTPQVTLKIVPSFFGVTGVAAASSGSTANYVSAHYSGSATASGTVEIIYTYVPVPEPRETAALMIVLALCVMLGRKYLPRHTPAAVRKD